jgi:hypothetical protein
LIAVTFHDVISTDHVEARNTFQIAMLANGDVVLTFLDANPHHDVLVGVAPGRNDAEDSSSDASSSSSFPPRENDTWGEDRVAGKVSYAQTDLSSLPVCQASSAAVLRLWAARDGGVEQAPTGEAEVFLANDDDVTQFDLSFSTLIFSATEGVPTCRSDATTLPVDPVGGSLLFLSDDDSEEVVFRNGFTFPFYGVNYTSVFVGSNGYLSFGEIDTDRRPTVRKHYELPRVSAMYADLRAHRGTVSWKQEGRLAVAVTFSNVPSSGNSEAPPSTFQILLTSTGDVRITYLQAQPTTDTVVGISPGRRSFPLPAVVDFSDGPACDKKALNDDALLLVAAQARGGESMHAQVAEAWLLEVDGGDSGSEPDDDNHGANVLTSSRSPPAEFPLDYTTLTFSPINGYAACRAPATRLPVDPTGGELVFLSTDASRRFGFKRGMTFPLLGETYSRFYIGSNGYITFTKRDTDYSPSLEEHFELPRISGLFTDMKSEDGSSISWKQVGEEVVAVTYDRMAATGREDLRSTFQILMFASGEVQITFLDVQPRRTAIVGLSNGQAQFPLASVDLPAKSMCSALSTFEPAVVVESDPDQPQKPPVGLAELFYDEFDLEYSSLTYAAGDYSVCRSTIPKRGAASKLPIDPSDGFVMELGDDNASRITFPDGFTFPFFGAVYKGAHVGSNGYLTFEEEDDDYTADLEDHYSKPRVSGLFTDLDLRRRGTVSWKQAGDDAVAITFEDVPAQSDEDSVSTFQMVLHTNGEVQLSYLNVALEEDAVVGLSAGVAFYPLSTADLSNQPVCAV